MRPLDNFSTIIVIALVVFAIFTWQEILFMEQAPAPSFSFLDVGQGDAALLTLPGSVQILNDAGPSRAILESVAEVMPQGDRYIDLAIISHPQKDHFGGFNYLLENYRFGAFIWNGRGADSEEWKALADKIAAHRIPLVAVGAGDRIIHKKSEIAIISPSRLLVQSAELNDTSIVALAHAPPIKALLSGDIGFSVENYLAEQFDIRADILKIPHHGSKYSSGERFLRAVNPAVAVAQVGKNRYGHPTSEAMSRLAAGGAQIFRNDLWGTITITAEDGKLRIFTEK